MLSTKPSDDAASTPAPTGKGRPTPTRKEAEAARKERARVASDPKAQRAAQKARRKGAVRELQQAYKTGDDSRLPARDKGPVKRLVRDVVDSRLGFAELFVVMLLLIVILTGIDPELASGMWIVAVFLVMIDLVWVRFKVRREVRRRFPDASLKGVTYYAVVRSLQMRLLRLPKTQVKIGQALPDTYR